MAEHTTQPQNKIPKRKRIPRSEAQEYILQAAEELFYKDGIRAVSMDAVVERSGINKMSLYRHFASKDDLILACFDRQRNDFRRKWEANIAKHPNNPRAQIMQFFNDLANAACASGYRGCCFINVAVEFPDPEHPARKLVFDHEKMLIQKIAEVTSALGVSDPKRLGLTLALLIQGTYAASQTFGTGSEPVRIVPDIVEKLLDDAL